MHYYVLPLPTKGKAYRLLIKEDGTLLAIDLEDRQAAFLQARKVGKMGDYYKYAGLAFAKYEGDGDEYFVVASPPQNVYEILDSSGSDPREVPDG